MFTRIIKLHCCRIVIAPSIRIVKLQRRIARPNRIVQ